MNKIPNYKSCFLSHPNAGCLSLIPKGYGTNKNEALHRALNAFFSGKTIMSLEIAEALLTTFFYTRKFQDMALSKRPIFNTLPKLWGKNYSTEDQILLDEVVDLASDLEVINNVSENLEKKSLQADYIFAKNELVLDRIPENSETKDLEERLYDLFQNNGFQENTRSESIVDVIVDQFKLNVHGSVLKKTHEHLLDDSSSLDSIILKASLESRVTSEDFRIQLKDFSEFLGCIFVIFSSCDKSPICSLVPSVVKIPVPIYLGVVLFHTLIFFLSLRFNCVECKASPCLCASQDSSSSEPSAVKKTAEKCRCGENKRSVKPSCKSTKRCGCFVNSKGCLTCSCTGCENPFGKRDATVKVEKTKLSQRLVESRASHAGKLSRMMDPADHLRVKPDWNIYEKILLRRIFRASVDNDLSVVYEIYCQYAKDKKCNYIREKKFETVKKAVIKLQSQDS